MPPQAPESSDPDRVLPGRPRATAADAERIAAEVFGRRGRATELPSDRDQNFRIDSDDGRFVLKLANTAESESTLQRQADAMQRLARIAPGAGPALVLTAGGATGDTVELESGRHAVRMVQWMEGSPWADVRPHSPALVEDLGRTLAAVHRALADLPPPDDAEAFDWDLLCAAPVLDAGGALLSGARQAILAEVRTRLGRLDTGALPRRWIHNDANDHNVLVRADGLDLRVAGIIDLGDMRFSLRAADLGIAFAYVLLDRDDPLVVLEALVRGYARATDTPLAPAELDAVWTLALSRLAVSVCMAARQRELEPDNEYLSVTEAPAWAALERWVELPPHLARAAARAGAGLVPCPNCEAVAAWLATAQPAEVVAGAAEFTYLDPAVESMAGDATPERRFGRYGEARSVYTADGFANAAGESRTVHLGVDLFAAAGTPVHAPLDGVVEALACNDLPLDYGPTLILRHEPARGVRFWTLYGHLASELLDADAPGALRVGDAVDAGQQIARMGTAEENGGWAPHLHLQVITDLLGFEGDFPGVAAPSEEHLWRSFLPDPSPLVGFDAAEPAPEPLAARRRERLAPNLSLSYRRPLHIVRGAGAYLIDARGRRYLDLVNNVCHVGHAHPDVVRAGEAQMAQLNTNTRYLHETILRCADKLVARSPDPLEVVFFTNSGSEANDLALRLARAHTGARGVIALDGAYHGNLQRLVDLSAYKHAGPGGQGPGADVRVAEMPDTYRGRHRGADAGTRYAESVATEVTALRVSDAGVSAFVHEGILSCGGQIPLPNGYLAAAYSAVRAAGGVCIADEVQVGFGRVGAGFWSFEEHGVVPDLVTMGKPMGNGHPVAGVLTTRAIAESFDTGMEYFNTFGGNPVSCAIAEAVLDVIDREGLVARAAELGAFFLTGLQRLRAQHPLIGDVRGRGLFLGFELVRDRETLEPAAAEASYLVERMRDAGFLLSTDGPLHNVIKIKPPLVISPEDIERTLARLDDVLRDTVLREAALRASAAGH